VKSPKPRNKAQRKVDYKNCDAQLSAEIMTRNYQIVYYVAENVGIIGILAYPKTIHSSKQGKGTLFRNIQNTGG
jgi:hypothetical protein